MPFDFKGQKGGRKQGVLYFWEKGCLMHQLPVHGWYPTNLFREPALPKLDNSEAKDIKAVPPETQTLPGCDQSPNLGIRNPGQIRSRHAQFEVSFQF
jgi:hypothetical protein